VKRRETLKLFAFAIAVGITFGALRVSLLPDLALVWALCLAVAVGVGIGLIAALRERRRGR
jgi:hypothetical protein